MPESVGPGRSPAYLARGRNGTSAQFRQSFGRPSTTRLLRLKTFQADDGGVQVIQLDPQLRKHFVQVHGLFTNEDSRFRFRNKSDNADARLGKITGRRQWPALRI